jgi:hypothetical protein
MKRATHRLAMQTEVALDLRRMPPALRVVESVWKGTRPPTEEDRQQAHVVAKERLAGRPSSLMEPIIEAQTRELHLGRLAVPGRWQSMPVSIPQNFRQ